MLLTTAVGIGKDKESFRSKTLILTRNFRVWIHFSGRDENVYRFMKSMELNHHMMFLIFPNTTTGSTWWCTICTDTGKIKPDTKHLLTNTPLTIVKSLKLPMLNGFLITGFNLVLIEANWLLAWAHTDDHSHWATWQTTTVTSLPLAQSMKKDSSLDQKELTLELKVSS